MLQDKPIYGKGIISLSFPHPIHGKQLHLKHAFGIYVTDQVRKALIYFFNYALNVNITVGEK